MIMSNKVYDILKWIAQVALPLVATFYVSLGGLWGLPYVEEISGTIMAVDALLGGLLQISSTQYKKLA